MKPKVQKMTIKAGDKIPDITLKCLAQENDIEDIKTCDIFKGKRILLFGLPGAFTPVCTENHITGYVEQADRIKADGIDEIICLSVNDPFVMRAWAEQKNATSKITMLPDSCAELTKALGMETDISDRGLGLRCRRFAMIVDNGVVQDLQIEKRNGNVELSSAENMCKILEQKQAA